MNKIEIKNRWLGTVLFAYEKENNTIKDTVVEAVNKGACLEGADLRGAYLEGADLRGENLRGAYLKGADLRGANLRGACLEGADIRGAYLEGADLRGAIIFYTDNNIDNISEVINNFIKDTNIKELSVYENHNQIPTRWNCIWKNVLVINQYKISDKEKEIEELTMEQICKELGRIVKVVK